MDTLNNKESNSNGVAVNFEDLSPSDEVLPPLPTNQYEDYLRECQDIRQSVVITGPDDDKQPASRTDSGEDHDDDAEAEWFRMAGLSDLVMSPSNTMITSTDGAIMSNHSQENLSSMTVLSTLTRPQREAVLRRISSFNRAQVQKTKRRSKPSIAQIFPDVKLSPVPTPSDHEKSIVVEDSRAKKQPTELPLGSLSVAPEAEDAGSEPIRRFSEVTRTRAPTMPAGTLIDFSDTSHSKMDYLSKHKKNVDSIVASNISGANYFEKSVAKQQLVDASHSQITILDKAALLSDQPQSSPFQLSLPCITSSSSSLPDLSSRAKCSISSSSVFEPKQLALSCDCTSSESCVASGPAMPTPSTDIVILLDPSMLLQPSGRLLQFNEAFFHSTKESISSNDKSLSLSSEFQRQTYKSASSSTSPVTKRHFLGVPNFTSGNNSLRSANKSNSSDTISNSFAERSLKPETTSRKFSFSFSNLPSLLKTVGCRKLSSVHVEPSFYRTRSLKEKKKTRDTSISAASKRIETLSISSNDSWKENKFSDTTHPDGPEKNLITAKDDNLPNFSLVKDRLGVTKMCDLHHSDFRKVQSLAVIELTALFDVHNLDMKRRKIGKSKLKEAAVFGTPLTTLIDLDRKRTNNNNLRVPVVMSEIIYFLEKNALKNEGILRKSGSAARIKALKNEIDTNLGANGSQSNSSFFESQLWKDAHPNDVAALLKQFLRELPEPLLTSRFIDAFQCCSLIPDRKQQLQALNLLVILISDVHRDSLKLLLKFLNLVITQEEENKMSLSNVAMITAPNLFITGRKSSKKDASAMQDLKHAEGTSNIVRMLIKYHKLLWTVPAFMLSQVRVMNGAQLVSKKHHSTSKDKYKKFFQAGRSKDMKKLHITSRQPFDYETPKGLIRVQAPNMKLTSIAVQLDDKLAASDVIFKYRRQLERMHPTVTVERPEINDRNYALFEVGGNIHERCLDSSTVICALLRENPETTWFIKPRPDS